MNKPKTALKSATEMAIPSEAKHWMMDKVELIKQLEYGVVNGRIIRLGTFPRV